MPKLAILKIRSLIIVTIFLIPSMLLASRLHVLVRANDVEAVRAYIEGTPRALFEINGLDEHRESPIQIARSLGNDAMVQLLKEKGASDYGELSNSPFKRKPRRESAEIPIFVDATPSDMASHPQASEAAAAPSNTFVATSSTATSVTSSATESRTHALADLDDDNDIGAAREDPNGGFFFQFDEE